MQPAPSPQSPPSSAGDAFNEDYFLRGAATGVSLYSDYRWLSGLTIPMVRRIVEVTGIIKTDTVLDFGASRGYIVKAFRQLGYHAVGVDISDWAVENCDPEVKDWLSVGVRPWPADWIISKDVLEHIPEPELQQVIKSMVNCAAKGIFVVVPLSPKDGEPYVVPDYEKDVTHQIRWTLETWAKVFVDAARDYFTITAVHRIPGIKDNYASWEKGNGFITLIAKE